MPDCSVCESDLMKCDTCSKEGAKFDSGESKCIVGDDDDDDDGGLGVGAIIGKSNMFSTSHFSSAAWLKMQIIVAYRGYELLFQSDI